MAVITRSRDAGPAPTRLLRRPLVAGALLAVAYLTLSLANDPTGYLGTDTGGKVATLEVMAAGGGLDADVGYWAEEWDPDGSLHPLWYTRVIGDRWVNVTTLPATYVALPFYAAAGYRGALALPIVGAVATAFAARALARRLTDDDPDRAGWLAYWVVGLASPVTIYALDFWEHTLGLALMAWGIVALVDLVDPHAESGRRHTVRLAVLAGLAFGAAATLRSEAVVYAIVATAVALIFHLRLHRRLAETAVVGLVAVGGAALPLMANTALEAATLGAPLRAARGARTAASAAGGAADQLATRGDEALLTTFSLLPAHGIGSYFLGATVGGLIAVVAYRSWRRRDPTLTVVAGVAVVCLYVLRAGEGLGFVPGMAVAWPLVGAGLVLAWRSTSGRFAAYVAILALPLVWALQFTGGAAPQWAGRYVLTTGLLLTVAAVAGLGSLERWVRVGLVGLAIGVTVFGLGWLGHRSHGFGDFHRALDARDEPVLIFDTAHLAREGGAYYADARWLTAITSEEREEAAAVVAAAGFDTFALVEHLDVGASAPGPIGGFDPEGTGAVELFDDVAFRVTTYTRH